MHRYIHGSLRQVLDGYIPDQHTHPCSASPPWTFPSNHCCRLSPVGACVWVQGRSGLRALALQHLGTRHCGSAPPQASSATSHSAGNLERVASHPPPIQVPSASQHWGCNMFGGLPLAIGLREQAVGRGDAWLDSLPPAWGVHLTDYSRDWQEGELATIRLECPHPMPHVVRLFPHLLNRPFIGGHFRQSQSSLSEVMADSNCTYHNEHLAMYR